MIPALDGWRNETISGGVSMVHADGKETATIRYRERARPLRRLGALVRDILGRTPGWTTTASGAPERLVTFEGEHAALVTVAGTQDGRAAQRDLGFVFGDDFFSSIGGLSLEPTFHGELTGLVRELTRRDAHALGVRRRRFEYDPPAGWQPVGLTGFAVQWLAPGYPRDSTHMKVYAAVPRGITEGMSVDRIVDSLKSSGHLVLSRRQLPPLDVRGLAGTLEEIRPALPGHAPSVCRFALLGDERYVYPLEMWCAHELSENHSHWATLQSVINSVVPVPPPSRAGALATFVSHWLD